MKLTNRSHTRLRLPLLTVLAAAPCALAQTKETGGEFIRTIVGFEQAGASSSASVQKFFLDVFVGVPFPVNQKEDPDFGPAVRTWGNVRITSVPQQIESTIGAFAAQFPQRVADLKVNEVAQAAEFLAGAEVRISGMRKLLPSFAENIKQKFSLHLIFSGGATTPLTPKDTLQVFSIKPGTLADEERRRLESLYPHVRGKTHVAFVTADRDRFFRQYFGGFRFKSHYFEPNGSPLKRFPATLDIQYGQNEAVTGGRMRGGVLRLEGFYPLPYENVKFLYLFGTAMMKLSRTRITDPLLLQPANQGIRVPSAEVAMVMVPQINRDYYRLGLGIDFVELSKVIGGRPAAPPTPLAKPGT